MSTPREVLDFWFGEPAGDQATLMRQAKRWFGGGPAFDQEIRQRFGADVERAIEGELSDWEQTSEGLLALIILLDQFTRGVHRGSPRAFAGDARARALAERLLASAGFAELGWMEKQFTVMPLLHSEDLEDQRRSLDWMTRLAAAAPPPADHALAMGVEQAQKYHAIITRFGRFPHRNAVLGREATPDELEFMKDWQAKAAPSGMRDERR